MDVHLVDGTYELFRYHFALPSHVTKAGQEVGATRGVAGSMLQLLEDEGLIRGEDSDGKRRFTLTDTGRAEQEKAEGVAPWDAIRADFPAGQLQMRRSVGPLIAAIRTIAHDGTEEQQRQVGELLDETRRKVYAILAEDKHDQE